jgi:L-lactate dehydrogenase complex protein LldG
MSGDRAAIFARIREALKEPAPRHHEDHAPVPAASPVTAPFREWLPQVGPKADDRIALFAKLSEMLKTEFVICANIGAAAKHLAHLAQENRWKTIATHGGKLTNAVTEQLPENVALLKVDGGYDKSALEACEAGLTECECLIAQTGSICATTRSSGGRALSVLPPHHVVIASKSQLLPDLTAAYELLAQRYATSGYPSYLGFITGPSRTGDIERILVLGAHGPKKLTVLLVG